MGFPTKNDQHLGCEMGVSPFKETPISTGVPDSLPAVGLPPGLSVSINPESYSEGMFSWQGHLDR